MGVERSFWHSAAMERAKLNVSVLAILADVGAGLVYGPALLASEETPEPPAAPSPEIPDALTNPVDWGTIATFAVSAVILLVTAALIAAAVLWAMPKVSARRARSKRREAGQERERAVQAELIDRWNRAVAIHGDVHRQHSRFLFPQTTDEIEDRYFSLALLDDVNEPATQRFYEALQAMDARYRPSLPPGADAQTVDGFAGAAIAAQRTYAVAADHSRSCFQRHVASGGRSLTRQERRAVRQAQGLLRQALDESADVDFARNALDRAEALLSAAGFSVSARLGEHIIARIESRTRAALPA